MILQWPIQQSCFYKQRHEFTSRNNYNRLITSKATRLISITNNFPAIVKFLNTQFNKVINYSIFRTNSPMYVLTVQARYARTENPLETSAYNKKYCNKASLNHVADDICSCCVNQRACHYFRQQSLSTEKCGLARKKSACFEK
jgi:hypothetical protein